MKRATFGSEGAILKSGSALAFPQISLDRSSSRPLYRQLVLAIRQVIGEGALKSGARLPSSRALARSLGLSRNTVLCAYEELASAGFLEGKAGSGTRVAAGIFAYESPHPTIGSRETWRSLVRASHYPAETVGVSDPNGAALYLYVALSD